MFTSVCSGGFGVAEAKGTHWCWCPADDIFPRNAEPLEITMDIQDTPDFDGKIVEASLSSYERIRSCDRFARVSRLRAIQIEGSSTKRLHTDAAPQ